MPRPSGWKKQRTKPRPVRDLTPAEKRKVLHNQPVCWFRYPGICTVKSTQVHHIVDVEDGGDNEDDNLVGACEPCHTHYSAQQSQKRAVQAAWDWKRRPERHPGVLD